MVCVTSQRKKSSNLNKCRCLVRQTHEPNKGSLLDFQIRRGLKRFPAAYLIPVAVYPVSLKQINPPNEGVNLA